MVATLCALLPGCWILLPHPFLLPHPLRLGFTQGPVGKVDCCQRVLSERCLCDLKQRPVSMKGRSAFRSQERDLPEAQLMQV